MANTPGRILLVDSNPLLLNLQKDSFYRQRINVAGARSSAEALRMIKALSPQVILLAYDLCDESGADCCKRIKNHPEHHLIPVILLAPASPKAVDDCWKSGCDGVMTRPVNRRELTHVTQKFIDLSQRTAPRINVQLLVRYGFDDVYDHHDYTVNLSAGGCYLASEHAGQANQVINLEFLLPDSTSLLSCCGKIAWVNQGKNRLRQDLAEGFGVEFTSLEKDNRLQLLSFIMQTLRAGHP